MMNCIDKINTEEKLPAAVAAVGLLVALPVRVAEFARNATFCEHSHDVNHYNGLGINTALENY